MVDCITRAPSFRVREMRQFCPEKREHDFVRLYCVGFVARRPRKQFVLQSISISVATIEPGFFPTSGDDCDNTPFGGE
jgi:hypothetical protein